MHDPKSADADEDPAQQLGSVVDLSWLPTSAVHYRETSRVDGVKPLSPRFTASDRESLLTACGLTSAQVMSLERDLGQVLDLLGPHTTMDAVREELLLLDEELNAARRRVARWQQAARPSPLAEALGRLNSAVTAAEASEIRAANDHLPPYVVAADLIDFVGVLANLAAKRAPAKQRTHQPASAEAIGWIVHCLRRPVDPASKLAFAAIREASVEPKRAVPTLRGVCDIVFGAVYRALNAHMGRLGAKPPTSRRSIELYLKAKPKDQRRKPGRPRKAGSNSN